MANTRSGPIELSSCDFTYIQHVVLFAFLGERLDLHLTGISLCLSPGVDRLHRLHKDHITSGQTDHIKSDETRSGWIKPDWDQIRTEPTRLIQTVPGPSRRPVPVSYPGNCSSVRYMPAVPTHISEGWAEEICPLILRISLTHVRTARKLNTLTENTEIFGTYSSCLVSYFTKLLDHIMIASLS